MTHIRYSVMILLMISSVVHATPCPGLYLKPEDVGKFADWIIEGNVAEIRKVGTFRDCDRVAGEIYCADINKPEVISLDSTNVIQDKKGQFDSAHRVEISRMAHCFNGPLSNVMNAWPELNALGKRVRFYGRTQMAPPFFEPQLKPGYFWLEMLE
jgi:hypothetical protein